MKQLELKLYSKKTIKQQFYLNMLRLYNGDEKKAKEYTDKLFNALFLKKYAKI